MEQLCAMSNRYGGDENYVLAGGGNTSWKDGNTLYVKASGGALKTVDRDGFVAMDLEKLREMPGKSYPADDDAREAAVLVDMLAARMPGEEAKRPSVEATLHALFPYAFVLHVHPWAVNALSCGAKGEEHCRELWGDDAAWVPITKPGHTLAVACNQAFGEMERKRGKYPQIAILQNHGLFVAADTVAEIDALTNSVMDALHGRIKKAPDEGEATYSREKACQLAPALRMLYGGGKTTSAVFCPSAQVRKYLGSRESFAPLTLSFTPDHIVYVRAKPLYMEAGEEPKQAVEQFQAENGYLPKIVCVQDLGFYALGNTLREADIAKTLFLDAVKIASAAKYFGGPLGMTQEYVDFIRGWEVERHRSSVSLSGAGQKRLEGKIAIVTGSAQGFGKGIAASMAREGAHIVVADLNLEGAQACADELCAAHGEGCALAVAVNVAEEASVEQMVQSCVLRFGGLDILVSNAGIAIAGGLTEMTKEKFELVTSVNYTGYYLCVKHSVVPMKIQREYCPGYTMDVVEVNSKSGISGSNRNFAYAGSKFGGIGLTQSFALELVGCGIKVNAVCPGNYLDGPLWTDPEKGLFRQYFEAGKIPGAQSAEDVRRYYENLVPMKRGCDPEDVAKAIFYCVDQQYETGQAIPVTGGQVMLK